MVIGAVRVDGLDAALSATSGKSGLRRVPNVNISPADATSREWLHTWASDVLSGHPMRDLVIWDNRKGRWIVIVRAWIARFSDDMRSFPLTVNGVELGERPDWWETRFAGGLS